MAFANSIASVCSLSVESTATATSNAPSYPNDPTGGGGGGINWPDSSDRASTITSSDNPSGATGGAGADADGGGGGMKVNTDDIARGAPGVSGLVLIGALVFFVAHHGCMAHHGGIRVADSNRAGFNSAEGGRGHTPTREPALPDIGRLGDGHA